MNLQSKGRGERQAAKQSWLPVRKKQQRRRLPLAPAPQHTPCAAAERSGASSAEVRL